MITKKALRAFHNRKRKDYRHWKSLTPDKVREWHYDLLPFRPPIWKKLRWEQKLCLLIGIRTRRFFFMLDTGVGKTLISIAIVRYFRKLTNDFGSVLVLVPKNVNKHEWVRELKKHSPVSTYCLLTGSSKRKWEQLEETRAHFVICTYAGLARMVSAKVIPKKKKGKRQRKKTPYLKPDRKLVRRLKKKLRHVIADESIELGNSQTLPFRIVRSLTDSDDSLMLELNATPFGRDPAPLWSQMFLVDRGWTLGENLGLFRAAFYKEKPHPFKEYHYEFNQKTEQVLHNYIAHASIVYEADEATLPRVKKVTKHLSLGKDADQVYQEAKRKLVETRGNYLEQENLFIRMRQISSGFVGYLDDETGSKARYEFDHNPKLDLLIQVIESVQARHKFIVYHDFNYSGDMVSRELKKLGIGFLRLDGRTKDEADVLDRFDNDRKARGLLLNNKMGSGLNLQVARYGLFYERPTSWIKYKQGLRRFVRQYSDHRTVFPYDFIVKGTVDQQIIDYHKEGKDLNDAVLKGKARKVLL